MKPLDPIDVEHYSALYKKLQNDLMRAAEMLLPDAYADLREQLIQALGLIEKNRESFDLFLNSCSTGVLFNESVLVPVESNINNTVIGILWKCMDTISDILLLGASFDEFMVNLTVQNSIIWKLPDLVNVQTSFNTMAIDLEEASRLISYVIGKLDD